VRGLKRMGFGGLLRGSSLLPRAFAKSLRILRKFRPDVVVGVGGYASGPMVLAAALAGYPTAIQEQNSVPGITNRILGKFARAVFLAFDDARRFFAPAKVDLLGNPVRRRFVDAAVAVKASAAIDPSARRRLLVVGGSQGARAVNDLVTAAAGILRDYDALPLVVHQTGAADRDRIAARYGELGLRELVEVRPFIDDMAAAYAAADLVVGRAGALTLAELAVIGRPAILIPLPTAADDHQTRNAAELERAGAAVVLAQVGATPATLAELITALLTDEPRRRAMAAAMAGLARPDAARRIVDALCEIARPHGASRVS